MTLLVQKFELPSLPRSQSNGQKKDTCVESILVERPFPDYSFAWSLWVKDWDQ